MAAEAQQSAWNLENLSWTTTEARHTHPFIWPHPSYYSGRAFTPAMHIELGVLPGSRIALAETIDQPFGYNGQWRTTPPGSFMAEYARRMLPNGRWGDDTVERQAFDMHALEVLAVVPKSPEWVHASHDALTTLAQHTKLFTRMKKGVHAYQTRPYDVLMPDAFGRLHSTGPHIFHPVLDAVHTGAPKLQDEHTHMALVREEDSSMSEYTPFIEFSAYLIQATDMAKKLGGNVGALIESHLKHGSVLVAEYIHQHARYSKEYGRKLASSRAWYWSMVYPAYDVGPRDEKRAPLQEANSNVLWGSAILEHFLFLDELYQDLAALGISTVRPNFDVQGNTIQIRKASHMGASIRATEKMEKSAAPKPIDVTVSADRPLVIIGGNNQGKTWTQQTIAHALYESLQGRFAFAKSIKLPYLRGIFAIPAEIAQEQGESGYTTQLHRLIGTLREIEEMRALSPNEPVILFGDELFSGTDELEAAVLFQAFLNYCQRHNIIVLLGTNNELTFSPERAQFATLKNRRITTIDSMEGVIARRLGVPLLADAGMPQEVVARAAELVEIPTPKGSVERRTIPFTASRVSETLGLLISQGRSVRYGDHLRLLFRTEARPIFRFAEWLSAVFHTNIDAPIKELYRRWWNGLSRDEIDLTNTFFKRFGPRFQTMVELPQQTTREPLTRAQSESLIQNATEWLAWAETNNPADLHLPEDILHRIEPYWNPLIASLQSVVSVNTAQSDAELSKAIIEAVKPLSRLSTSSFDEVSGFLWLDELFTRHEFCRVTKKPGMGIDTRGLFSPSLKYEMESTRNTEQRLITNDIVIDPSRPNVLLGSNKSGKTRLLDALGVAAFFALHFDHAPAQSFVIGESVCGVIGLTDYTRDPDRRKDAGKWLTRQSQIADALMQAQKGGYILLLDEPDEGTNGFEGRATLRALAPYIIQSGNVFVLSTHKHNAIDQIDEEIGVNAYASGLGPWGRFSFAPGRASSLGITIAGEEGLQEEILLDAARILKEQMANTQ